MNLDLLWRKVFGSAWLETTGILLSTFKLCAGLPQHPKPFSRFRRPPFSIILIWEISWTKEISKQSAICGSVYFPAILISKAARSKSGMKCGKAAAGPTVVGSQRPREERCFAVWPNAWRGSPLDDTASVSSGAFYLVRKNVYSDSPSSYEKKPENMKVVQTSVMLCLAAREKRIDFLALSCKARARAAGEAGGLAKPCRCTKEDRQSCLGRVEWSLPMPCGSRWGEDNLNAENFRLFSKSLSCSWYDEG